MPVLECIRMRHSLFTATCRSIFVTYMHLTCACMGYVDMLVSVLVIFVVDEMITADRSNLEVFVFFGDTMGDSFRFFIISSSHSTSRRDFDIFLILFFTLEYLL